MRKTYSFMTQRDKSHRLAKPRRSVRRLKIDVYE